MSGLVVARELFEGNSVLRLRCVFLSAGDGLNMVYPESYRAHQKPKVKEYARGSEARRIVTLACLVAIVW